MIPVLNDSTNYRPTARGLRLNALELAELLTGAFDRVGDLMGDLLSASPRVRRDDERLFDREFGIFEPPDISVGPDPSHDDQKHQEKNDPIALDGRDAKVHSR